MSLEKEIENISLNLLVKEKLKKENVDKSIFNLLEKLQELNVFTLFIDTPQRLKYGASLNSTAMDILYLNCDKYLMYSCLTRFLSGKYILLLFQENTIGFLVNKINIKHCEMIYKATEPESGFAKPNMLFDKTPIIDLSLYSLDLSYEKIINIMDDLVKQTYSLYKKDKVSIEFYKALGFDYENHLKGNINNSY